MISEGHIEGTKSTDGRLGANYSDLKVTKSGLEAYKFWTTPIPNREANTMGGMQERRAWLFGWKAGYEHCCDTDTNFNETVREYLKQFMNWLMSLLS